MKKREYLEEIKKLKQKHGKSWHRKYRTRRNYPFGKKSACEYTIEEK